MMTDVISLADVDSDQAVQEAAVEISGHSTRAGFLARAALGGGGLLAGGGVLAALPQVAQAAPLVAGDVKILNFALTLEYLEATFYAEALKAHALHGRTLAFAKVVAAHEATHVKTLRGVLGSQAVAKPKFDFRGTNRHQGIFQKTAVSLEDTGVKAYKGQAPLIASEAVLVSALAIHAVEARHASWIRHIAGVPPAPLAEDPPATMEQVLGIVKETKFVL